MRDTYISNWQFIKDRFEEWWKCENKDKPLMRILAAGKPAGEASAANSKTFKAPDDPKELYLNVQRIVESYRNYCEAHYFLAEAFPAVDLNLGAGSMALYLGGEPEFTWETVWYKELCSSPAEFRDFKFDQNNRWWLTHYNMIKEAVEMSGGDFFVTIPDIIENADILSALRGPQNLCLDLIDEPDAVFDGVRRVDELYFEYYDRLYELTKDSDGSSSYTAFKILGEGKTAKIQCDFNVLISPNMFKKLVQPSLAKQCRQLDHSMFHLDGPGAVKHVPALMEIKELNALQWTSGAGQKDGSSEEWYPIYDQVREAGKALWIWFEDGSPKDWAAGALRLVKRYGPKGLYFLFPEFRSLAEAKEMAVIFG